MVKVTHPIFRGQTRKSAAANMMIKAIDMITNSDERDIAWNDKYPDDERLLFSAGNGVSAAMETLLDRMNFMLHGDLADA